MKKPRNKPDDSCVHCEYSQRVNNRKMCQSHEMESLTTMESLNTPGLLKAAQICRSIAEDEFTNKAFVAIYKRLAERFVWEAKLVRGRP